MAVVGQMAWGMGKMGMQNIKMTKVGLEMVLVSSISPTFLHVIYNAIRKWKG
jgi:hypothetical protein